MNANTSAEREAKAKQMLLELEAKMKTEGFNKSQIEVEQDLDDAIQRLTDKLKQPYANTNINQKKFKETALHPAQLKELTLRKVFLDNYRIQDIVKRLDRIDKQQEEIQKLLRKYEERNNFPPLTKPTNLYVKTNTLPKTRRASLPSLPGKGLFSRLAKTIRGRQKEEEGERQRSQSAGKPKRKHKSKTHKRKH